LTQQTCSNCGANFEDQQFCPDCGQWVDPLDETSFEEFSLGDTPPVDDDEPLRMVPGDVPMTQMVNCPSCGAANPAHNRHCEECGARVTQGPLPVAPQPMIRTTAGARALAVILGVVAVVAVIAFAWNAIFGGGDEPGPDDTTTTSTTQASAASVQLTPISVTCSSTLEVAANSFACDNLVDGTDRYWNDQSARGQDAVIEFTFSEPVAIEQIVFKNVVDDEAFKKNYRVQGFEITTDDLPDRPFIDQLRDDNGSQLILLATLRTRQVIFKVTSTYAAEAVTGETPFNELAINEFEFYGRPAG
jgi:ribosomal protein L32